MMKEENVEIQLFSSIDEHEINQVNAILKENNIPYITKNDGSGAYMNLYMGQSIQEKRIFINKEDYDKSLELIAPFLSDDRDEETTVETNKYVWMRRGLGFFLLGVPILVIAIIILLVIGN